MIVMIHQWQRNYSALIFQEKRYKIPIYYYYHLPEQAIDTLSKRLSVPDNSRRRASSVASLDLTDQPSLITMMSSMFAFAYVWAFGGHLHNR